MSDIPRPDFLPEDSPLPPSNAPEEIPDDFIEVIRFEDIPGLPESTDIIEIPGLPESTEVLEVPGLPARDEVFEIIDIEDEDDLHDPDSKTEATEATKKSSDELSFVGVIALSALAILISLAVVKYSGHQFRKGRKPGSHQNSPEGSELASPSELRQMLLSALAQQRFTGEKFLEELVQIPGIKFQLWVTDGNKVFVSIPQSSVSFDEKGKPQNWNALLSKLTDTSSSTVKVGVDDDGRPAWSTPENPVSLGGYQFAIEGKGSAVILISADKFLPDRVFADPKKKFSFPRGKYEYTISLNELNNFFKDKGIYNGKGLFDTGRGDAANHGAMVAKPGEPTLSRLAEKITAGVSGNNAIAQKLLDFCHNNVQYDQNEANFSVETLKRPSEILISGKSDCSGNAILYASLLEQKGIPYLIGYSWAGGTGHVTVFVKWEGEAANGYYVTLNGKRYTLTEPVWKGFQIGKTVPHGRWYKAQDWKLLQDVSAKKITNLNTGEVQDMK